MTNEGEKSRADRREMCVFVCENPLCTVRAINPFLLFFTVLTLYAYLFVLTY